jgi:predicted Zn-dependent protease
MTVCFLLRMSLWVVSSCVVCAQQVKIARGVNFYSHAQEMELGTSLSDKVNRMTSGFSDPRLTSYVSRLGHKMASVLPSLSFDYTFVLIRQDVGGSTHEPISLPGGQIYVPASLILAVHSEDELAGMLAHATAHIAERHATRLATRGKMVGVAPEPLVELIAGYAIGAETTRAAVQNGFLLLAGNAELEADQLATQMLSACDYNSDALIQYIQRVQGEPGSHISFSPSRWPVPAVRIANMEEVGTRGRRIQNVISQELLEIQNEVRREMLQIQRE